MPMLQLLHINYFTVNKNLIIALQEIDSGCSIADGDVSLSHDNSCTNIAHDTNLHASGTKFLDGYFIGYYYCYVLSLL